MATLEKVPDTGCYCPADGIRDERESTAPCDKRIERFQHDQRNGTIIREVLRRDGSRASSQVAVGDLDITSNSDLAAAFDLALLVNRWRIDTTEPTGFVRIVDLFSGCGGITLGVQEACRAIGLTADPLLAVDIDEEALEVYRKNIPVRIVSPQSVDVILNSDLGAPPSEREVELRHGLGPVDLLVGGPPCQGHSDLNNQTRRRDPKNALYLKMARFAEVCAPTHIIIENVLGVRHDSENVFGRTKEYLERLDYHVDDGILRGDLVGVPQTRARLILIASKTRRVTIDDILSNYAVSRPRSFAWACRDLADIRRDSFFDRPSNPTEITKQRIDYLFDTDGGIYDLPNKMRPRCHRGEHSYKAVYGRIHADEPAPTITTGFMVMGQGRFVHPTQRRTLTPHEAARIQCFPDWFEFGERTRTAYATLIGNAVPPKLAYVAALELLR